jgi:hypothetical protein
MEQVTIDPVSDEITAAAMADIRAAIDSMQRVAEPGADEAFEGRPEREREVRFAVSDGAAPAALGETAPAAAPETVGHGRIRLRIRRIASQATAGEASEPVIVREIVGHGTVRLRGREGQRAGVSVDVDISDRPLPGDTIGHGAIRLRHASDEPVYLDLTDSARADILEAIAATS